jgi:phytoene dehydrogenase-like protein
VARVVVVGGGFGGMAAAARLAKLGHEVTLVERSDHLGGALTTMEQDGFAWDAGPSSTLLPAVVRDLFRKSGRPLEREVDLQSLPLVREHRFADGTSLRLPGGSRAAQLDAFDELGPGLGQQWVDHVALYGDLWELLRKEWYERPYDPDVAPRELTALLDRRESLHKTCGTHRSSPVSTPSSSSASVPGPSPAASPRLAPRWPTGSRCGA